MQAAVHIHWYTAQIPNLVDFCFAPGFVEARLVGSDLGEDRVLTVVLRGLGCPVVGLELGWWDESDLAVKASSTGRRNTGLLKRA